jgi:hypothetical protein
MKELLEVRSNINDLELTYLGTFVKNTEPNFSILFWHNQKINFHMFPRIPAA